MKKAGLAVAGILAFLGLLTYLTLSGRNARVEVCMQHRGQQACRSASGATRDAAVRTAIDNACALIAFGVTENGQCSRSRPVSIRDLQ